MIGVVSPASIDVSADAASLLRLLGDTTRRRIFLLVMHGEICNCEVAEMLALPQNLVSHHLRKLREAGFVDEHRDPHDARWVHYTVNHTALAQAWRGLERRLQADQLTTRLPRCHARAT